MPDVKVIAQIFSDTLPGGLELVGLPKSDTVKAEDGLIRIRTQYTVTAFEEALYSVPALPFIDGKDTVFSNSVSIKVVQPFQIDTVTQTFADIKPVMNLPYNWARLLKILSLIFLITSILVLIIILLIKYIQKKPIIVPKKPEIVLPPDVLALLALDKIKAEKLWQTGQVKEFHTAITGVIREYISKIFAINSMEMTSEAILDEMNNFRKEKPQAYEGLKQILRLGDLAKFANFNPLPDENEESLKNACDFVFLTNTNATRF
jgi:hypothetical protein